jgi:hypothetical protein
VLFNCVVILSAPDDAPEDDEVVDWLPWSLTHAANDAAARESTATVQDALFFIGRAYPD